MRGARDRFRWPRVGHRLGLHDATVTTSRSPPRSLADASADLVIVGPETALAAGVADECFRRRIPCFGPTADLARLESSKSYTRELATVLGLPVAAPLRDVVDRRGNRLVASARRPDRREAGWSGRRQGRRRTRHRRGHTGRDHDTDRLGPIVLEERLDRPGMQPDGAVRRQGGASASDRPGPQADRRGRHRAQHRRDGRIRAGADRVRRRRRSPRRSSSRSSTTSLRPARRTSGCCTPG